MEEAIAKLPWVGVSEGTSVGRGDGLAVILGVGDWYWEEGIVDVAEGGMTMLPIVGVAVGIKMMMKPCVGVGVAAPTTTAGHTNAAPSRMQIVLPMSSGELGLVLLCVPGDGSVRFGSTKLL